MPGLIALILLVSMLVGLSLITVKAFTKEYSLGDNEEMIKALTSFSLICGIVFSLGVVGMQLQKVRTIEAEHKKTVEKIREIAVMIPDEKLSKEELFARSGMISTEGLKGLKVETEVKRKLMDLIIQKRDLEYEMYKIKVSPWYLIRDIEPYDNTKIPVDTSVENTSYWYLE